MLSTLLANGSLFACLLFGWFYFWTVSPQWQVPTQAPLAAMPLLLSGVLLSAAALYYRRLVARLCRGQGAGLATGLWICAALGLAHALALLWLLLAADLAPRSLAHDAALAVMLGYLLFHGALTALLTALQARRVQLGYVGVELPYEPVVLQPLWSYSLVVFWISFAAFILMPMAW